MTTFHLTVVTPDGCAFDGKTLPSLYNKNSQSTTKILAFRQQIAQTENAESMPENSLFTRMNTNYDRLSVNFARSIAIRKLLYYIFEGKW